MKILFICRQNVGRSQIAMAYYNSLTCTDDAKSAGTNVDSEGQTIHERKEVSHSKNFFVIDVMNDDHIDISNFTRHQVKPEDLPKYDRIIAMVDLTDLPKWLATSPKLEMWRIPDPRGLDYAHTANIRDAIKDRVANLIANSTNKDSR